MKKRKKKRGFSIIDEYKKSYEYLKDSKKFIYAVIIIFLFFGLVGFFIPTPDFLYEQIMDFITELLEKISGMSQSQLISFITLNNLKSTFFSIFLGIIFGIIPIIGAVSNGYLLGFASFISVSEEGIVSLWKIFPHGIFELPAVFISLGLGLKLGMFMFQKDKLKSFRNYMINSLRVFLLIVLPLLIIAGIIEGTLIALSG